MRRTIVLAVSVIAALPVFAAAGQHRPIRSISTVTERVSQPADSLDFVRIWADLHASIAAHRAGTAHVNAVADERSAHTLVIPAAGSTPGGGGTLFFRSDVTIANYNGTTQNILVTWWAAGSSNPPATAAANSKVITVNGSVALTFVDFVNFQMGKTGLGALVLIPITAAGQIDPNAAIDAYSRIYTRQPNSTGTVSQPFDGTDPDNFSAGDTAVALGLRQDVNFRTNFGLVNLEAASHTFHVTFDGEHGSAASDTTMLPYSMTLTNIPGGDYGAIVITYEVTDPGSGGVTWIGFASSTDNTTGDGWVAIASANLNGQQLNSSGF
jgi:hypothetical protein